MKSETKFISYKKYFFLPVLLILCIMCSSEVQSSKVPDPYYISGTKKEKENLKILFSLLSGETNTNENNFAVLREIANIYKSQDDYPRLINFLSDWVSTHPDDPYNTYYLFMTAFAYSQQGSESVASLYFNMIVKNYPDLIVKDKSIHLLCLKKLLDTETDPQQKIWYYEELLSRFRDEIDLGTTLFLLGQTYEDVGDWKRAIQSYNDFLPFYGVVVSGFPDAYNYAKQMVDLNSSARNWTFESLDSIVRTIKRTIDSGDTYALWQYHARVNFFARAWVSQAGSDDTGVADFNISAFGTDKRVNYANELSRDSNANEVYLRTWGWSHFTPVWYFYFRKIYFPPDPEIHGRWEWAGIYYGERF
ncbi:MAG: tetratricopeptide repeat-containing protein [Spirochaetaceae bacterium]|jgi:tetratricopeptide (TPR) repeat protein|nr:tetratricopeptide repeat-containing protein [Spirochaetaceae bacterium]